MNTRSDHLGILGCALAASLLLLTTKCSAAPDVTFSICADTTLAFRQKAGSDKLEVFCGKLPPAGDNTPAPFNIVGCIGPHPVRTPPVTITKMDRTTYTIPAKYSVTCDRFVAYDLVKK